MSHGFLRSLRGQTIVAVLIGLIISHAIAITIYSGDRGDAITLAEAEEVVERIAGVVVLMSELDPPLRERVAEQRQRWAADTDAKMFSLYLAAEPTVRGEGSAHELGAVMEPYLRTLLANLPEAPMILEVDAKTLRPGRADGDRGSAVLRFLGGIGGKDTELVHRTRASIRMDDGRWLNFSALIPVRGAHWPGQAGIAIILVAGSVMLLLIWAVNRVTRPLEGFAAASDRLGRDINATPLPETGPSEVVRAVRAFNAMQVRLRDLVENRTHMLAAISHDLKTPITLLRLRAELLDDPDTQQRFVDTLDEMSAMIDSFLAFARSTSEHEPLRRTDLSALVGGICDDLKSAGLPVDDVVRDDVVCLCRPREIRRAVLNLIDNAVKYGTRAHVHVGTRGAAAEITVSDEGPGMPRSQIEQACTPFFRGDASRNPETGGVGLGLSTTQAILRGHGGELRLENGADGGLIARATLPM